MFQNINVNINQEVATVTIDRPKAMNALNTEVLQELLVAFDQLGKDDEVRAIILTGAGKAFVAGADIGQMHKLTAIEGRKMMQLGHKVMHLMESTEKPIIAAVNGYALGGGCELSMACDIRIASENAKFGQPEVGLGIIPGFGGTQRLSRLVGKGMAKYLIMTGDIIDSQEAYRIGLVEKVTPADQLMDEALKIAKTIASKAPIAVATAKTVINKGYDLDLISACQLEIEGFTAGFSSEDKAEGMGAFLEKRKAQFKNK